MNDIRTLEKQERAMLKISNIPRKIETMERRFCKIDLLLKSFSQSFPPGF